MYPTTTRINRSGCVNNRVKRSELGTGPWWFQNERVRLYAQRAAPGTRKPDTKCWDVYLELWSRRFTPGTSLTTGTQRVMFRPAAQCSAYTGTLHPLAVLRSTSAPPARSPSSHSNENSMISSIERSLRTTMVSPSPPLLSLQLHHPKNPSRRRPDRSRITILTADTPSLSSPAPTRSNCSLRGARRIRSRSSTCFRTEVVSSAETRSSWKLQFGRGLR
jgi:hypothetical protein